MMSGMQVIRMLRGAHDPGSAFSLDRREGSFSVMQHTHVPHMSHRSLLHMLNTFAAAGTDLLRCAGWRSAFWAVRLWFVIGKMVYHALHGAAGVGL